MSGSRFDLVTDTFVAVDSWTSRSWRLEAWPSSADRTRVTGRRLEPWPSTPDRTRGRLEDFDLLGVDDPGGLWVDDDVGLEATVEVDVEVCVDGAVEARVDGDVGFREDVVGCQEDVVVRDVKTDGSGDGDVGSGNDDVGSGNVDVESGNDDVGSGDVDVGSDSDPGSGTNRADLGSSPVAGTVPGEVPTEVGEDVVDVG